MFYRYRFSASIICLGERLKKGTYRPTVKTIPSSQIMGALQKEYGVRVPAAGYFTEPVVIEHTTFSSSDHFSGTAKIPLTVEYLREPEGFIFIKKTDCFNLPARFTMRIGALKSKGFGYCMLKRDGEILSPVTSTGRLKTRLYESLLTEFGITRVFQPVYGYLFMPTGETDGYYNRSLFEGSIVEGYDFLLEVNDDYD